MSHIESLQVPLLTAAPPWLTSFELKLLGLVLLGTIAFSISRGQLAGIFLLWNCFLAWVPIALLRLSAKLDKTPAVLRAGVWIGWLLFLPNAPYIVTDFVHPLNMLARGQTTLVLPASLWIGVAAVLGLSFYVRAVRRVLRVSSLSALQQKHQSWMLYGLHLIVAYGVWLGRSLRFNTWDVVAQPLVLLQEAGAYLASLSNLAIILATAALLALTQRVSNFWWPEITLHRT